jgi:hypothetical protein
MQKGGGSAGAAVHDSPLPNPLVLFFPPLPAIGIGTPPPSSPPLFSFSFDCLRTKPPCSSPKSAKISSPSMPEEKERSICSNSALFSSSSPVGVVGCEMMEEFGWGEVEESAFLAFRFSLSAEFTARRVDWKLFGWTQ